MAKVSPEKRKWNYVQYHPLEVAAEHTVSHVLLYVEAQMAKHQKKGLPSSQDLATEACMVLENKLRKACAVYEKTGSLEDALSDPVRRPPHLASGMTLGIVETLVREGSLSIERLDIYSEMLADKLSEQAAKLLDELASS